MRDTQQKAIALLCLFLQLATTVTGSLLPVTAALAGKNTNALLLPPSTETTQPYTLKTGETIASVAKQHGISVQALKRMNVFRTFNTPFDLLSAGDEIDVPLVANTIAAKPDAATASQAAQQLHSAVTTTGQLLSSSDLSGEATSRARGMVTSAATAEVQQWLSQYGTALVQLSVDKDLTLEGSSLDWLTPWYDTPDAILFTQAGVRHKDSRTTLNLGAGVRTFQGGWMYGMNTFFDNDVTGKNRRVGVGAEAWTDYLKLSANSYFGITDWHQSRDFADYNERPANGYDVRAEAYLPAYPQLGGKLMYEQYRGDEVALFGKDERQKNPHAITMGINYTPIPLFTVGAEHRAGNGGNNDSLINVQFNYRLGESWQSHIDPSGVAASRTLSGSRYDLVERNNNIVLDYKKQELTRLTLPERVTGESSSSATVNARVTSKYGLERIEWDSAALAAAGGNLVQVSPQTVSLSLPPYQATRSSNTYTLSAVAYDRRGNASSRATMQIVVIPGTGELSVGNLRVTADNAIANGVATNAVQALVTDVGHQPIANQAVSFKASNGATVTTVIGTTGADGIATATLTSKAVGTSEVTATVNGNTQTVSTTFVEGPAEALNSAIGVDSDSYVSGTDIQVTVTLQDANNNPVTGQRGLLTSSTVTVPNTTGAPTWSDNTDGTYSATYTATTAGAELKATLTIAGVVKDSAAYAITLETEAPASINTQVNGYTFEQTSQDGTFPTTGFTGATFTIVPQDNKNASDYDWSSNANWVSVTKNGVVEFTNTGTRDKVIITGTPINGQGKIIKYSFTLNSWFINNGFTESTWSEANGYCLSRPGYYSLPSVEQMTINDNYTATTSRGTGALWNEWGSLRSYRDAGFSGLIYWSSEQKSSGNNYMVLLSTGVVSSIIDRYPLYVVCRQGL